MYLKWVGGKTQLAGQILSLFPKEGDGAYIEPFFGSGAMYFAFRKSIRESDIFNSSRFVPSHYIFGDTNPLLINCHLAVKSSPKELEELLIGKEKEHEYSPTEFYNSQKKLVTQVPDLSNGCDLEAAARFIYINKSCFNGIWRVNRSGLFNVPWNQKETINLVNKKLHYAHKLLQGCEINLCSYKDRCSKAVKGDFVYLDPPYVPLSESSSFTAYTEDGFSLEDLSELRQICDDMDKKGIKWMMSNSTAKIVYDEFSAYNIHEVYAHRFVKALKENEKREKIKETVVTNY